MDQGASSQPQEVSLPTTQCEQSELRPPLAPCTSQQPLAFQACCVEPQELPNGLGPGPLMLPDAEEMGFTNVLNSGEGKGWSPFRAIADPEVDP